MKGRKNALMLLLLVIFFLIRSVVVAKAVDDGLEQATPFVSIPDQQIISISEEEWQEGLRQQEDEIASEQFKPTDVFNQYEYSSTELGLTPSKTIITYGAGSLTVENTNKATTSSNRYLYILYDSNGSEKVRASGYYSSSQKAISTFSIGSFADGNYYIWRYMQSSAQSTNYIGQERYDFVIRSQQVTFETAQGSHEDSYYKNLVASLDASALNDIPELYYTTGTSNYYYVGDQMDAIVNKAKELTAGCTTTEQKVKAIHDWICKNIAYDHEYLQTRGTGLAYAKVSAPKYVFESGRGVCAGYSRLNQVMLTSLHIPCVNIMGYSDTSLSASTDYSNVAVNHEWNIVYIDDEWFLFDLTWDSLNKYYGANSASNKLNSDARYTYYGIYPAMFGGDHYSTKKIESYYVTNIDISRQPSKTIFKLGESFSSDLTLQVTDSSGYKTTVGGTNSNVYYSGYDLSKTGLQTVTVSYKGRTTSYTISVVKECSVHTPSDWIILTQPNCFSAGKKQKKCIVCDEVLETETIAQLKHEYDTEYRVYKEPTCI